MFGSRSGRREHPCFIATVRNRRPATHVFARPFFRKNRRQILGGDIDIQSGTSSGLWGDGGLWGYCGRVVVYGVVRQSTHLCQCTVL